MNTIGDKTFWGDFSINRYEQKTKTQQPATPLQTSPDTVELSTEYTPQKPTIKERLAKFIDNITAVKPSALTYMRYGGLQTVKTIGESHHKDRTTYKYVKMPVGTKVQTPYGIKTVKENQIVHLSLDGNFSVEDIEKFIIGETVTDDTGGLVINFCRKKIAQQEAKEQERRTQIDNDLNQAGIKYLGRLNKNDPEHVKPDKVFIEINGEKRELGTVLYTADDYEYKEEILRLHKTGELDKSPILFY